MKDKKELLGLRKKIKDKKPTFIKQDVHKRKKLAKHWRKPKGLQSKMRLKLNGYRRSVTPGWGSPKEVYGLDRSGLKIIKISTITELNKLNPQEEGALISSTVGLKKKTEIIKKAKEKGITLLNIKDSDKWLKDTADKLEKKKQEKNKKQEKKAEKKKETEKKEKKEEKLAEKLTEEEKKQQEKEEKDKLLTKKQ